MEEKIRAAICEVEKRCGNGTVMALDNQRVHPQEAHSTGSVTLDRALGIGGLPKGRVVEIYGPESSGKTTMTLSCIAQAQAKGKICAFVDAEHALDLNYAKRLGVIPEHLLLSQPDYGEQGLEIVDTLIQTGSVDLVVVDSVAALVPKAEIDGEMTDQQMGLHARLMSKALRKITAHCARHNTTVIFINQIRHKIGVIFGSPETTTGGQALKFFSSVRMDIRKIGQIKAGEESVGTRVRVKVVKNKMAPPFGSPNSSSTSTLGSPAPMRCWSSPSPATIFERPGPGTTWAKRPWDKAKRTPVTISVSTPLSLTNLNSS